MLEEKAVSERMSHGKSGERYQAGAQQEQGFCSREKELGLGLQEPRARPGEGTELGRAWQSGAGERERWAGPATSAGRSSTALASWAGLPYGLPVSTLDSSPAPQCLPRWRAPCRTRIIRSLFLGRGIRRGGEQMILPWVGKHMVAG